MIVVPSGAAQSRSEYSCFTTRAPAGKGKGPLSYRSASSGSTSTRTWLKGCSTLDRHGRTSTRRASIAVVSSDGGAGSSGGGAQLGRQSREENAKTPRRQGRNGVLAFFASWRF